jgi:1-acyl-sn-glycerol-3-phosphate acyltransferase
MARQGGVIPRAVIGLDAPHGRGRAGRGPTGARAPKALLQCARYLRQHCSVVFFPEGTRSPDRHVLPFNEGPFQLAIREHIPILPLVVDGSGAALPRNSWIFGSTQDIYLRILEAVSVDGWNHQAGAGAARRGAPE